MNKKWTQLGEIQHQTQNLKKKKIVNLKTSLVANKTTLISVFIHSKYCLNSVLKKLAKINQRDFAIYKEIEH